MDHQPARAFRNPHPHHEYDQAEARANEIGQPPAMVRRKQLGIEQHDGGDRADRSTNPETSVDHEIGPAAIARRHQFLDRRIDRGVFAADTGAGQEAKQRITCHAPGQRRRRGRRQIDRQRDEEQFLASDAVRQPAEAERAEHGTGEIRAVGQPDVEIRKLQRRAFLQRTRQRACQRDLQPVEDPGDAEREHDAGVKAAPAQPIEPRRYAGLDDAIIVLGQRRRSRGALIHCRTTPYRFYIHRNWTNEKRPGTPQPQGCLAELRQT